jgi:hypothetical protein
VDCWTKVKGKLRQEKMESPFGPTVADFLKGPALFGSFEASPARPYGNIMSLRRVWSTGGMILTGESRSAGRGTCIIFTLFTRSSDGLAGDRTEVRAVRGRRLTA